MKGGPSREENSGKKERIIPIRVLSSPHTIDEEEEEEDCHNTSQKRHSLTVTLDDGTLTETSGTSIRLGSSKMEDRQEETDESNSSTSRTERIRIEEIGIDTLKREIRGGGISEAKVSSVARLVPISLPDGKILQTEPEETLTTTSEYTSTSHEEFSSPRLSATAKKPPVIIPITLKTSGESIIPSFTSLEDLKPPDWSVFSQKPLVGNGEEKVIPIKLEESSEPVNESKEIIVTEEALTKSGYKGHAKKTDVSRPTVRFTVDESSEDEERKKAETEDAIYQIDKDISKIWKELKELEPRSDSSVSSWPKTTNPPPKYPKPSQSIPESPKYTPIRDSSLTRPGSIKSSPGTTTKSIKTADVSNLFGPASSSAGEESINEVPRKGSTASMTVITSTYKPTPSFAQPLTIKRGVIKPSSPNSHETPSPPTEDSQEISQQSLVDKETQTTKDLGGKHNNCKIM